MLVLSCERLARLDWNLACARRWRGKPSQSFKPARCLCDAKSNSWTALHAPHMRQVLGNAPGRPQLAGRLPVKLLFSSALRCSKP